MALVFEYQKTLSTGALPFICAEKDSTLYNYYMSNDTALDTHARVPYGQYDEVIFANEGRHLTTKAISKIGIKGFPGIGAVGFYKEAYSDDSHVIAPIHTERDKTNAPKLVTAEVKNDKLHIVITPPEDITYGCYRVVVRQDPFAFEYILYETDYNVDLPTVKGDYTVYCIGYDEDNNVVSEDSNILTLNIEAGTDTWEPVPPNISMRLIDLTDVNIVDILNAQMLRYNAETQKWENVDATAVGATRIVEITLPASAWQIDEALNTHYQNVTIAGTTEYSKVDLQPTEEQLIVFHERDINFTTVNEDGTIVVYVVGDKPEEDYTIQATVTEVTV